MILYPHFDVNEKGNLTIGGIDSVELAKEFGTPAYIIDESVVRSRCREYLSAAEKSFGKDALPLYASKALCFTEIADRWNSLFAIRDDVMKALELARAEKLVGKSLEAKITLYTKDEEILSVLNGFGKELNTVFIVSGVCVLAEDAPANAHTDGTSGIGVLVEPADGYKCDRCWSFSTEGKHTEEDGFICARCAAILKI